MVEEGGKGVIVGLQLALEVGLTRSVCMTVVGIGGRVRDVDIVRVRDVAIGHRYASRLHLLHVTKRVLRQHSIETRKATIVVRVRDRLAGRVADAGIAAGDRGVDVFSAVKCVVADVVSRLVL